MLDRRTPAVLVFILLVAALVFYAYLSHDRNLPPVLIHHFECNDQHGLHSFAVKTPKTGTTYYDPIAPTPPRPLDHTPLPAAPVPERCIDDFVAHGKPCFDEDAHPPRFDIVWTYVNGSDTLHRLAAAYYEPQEPVEPYQPVRGRPASAQKMRAQKMWRDHDELRHSIRSVLANFRQHASTFHVLTADFDMPDDVRVENTTCAEHNITQVRLGQVPQWLDLSKVEWRDGDVQLKLSHHSEFFTAYNGTVFNSFGIESQIGHLSKVAEYFVYMNDDYFFYSSLSPFDFYTSAYGIVFRLQSDAVVKPASMSPTPSKGEWLSLEHSNQLLSERFGMRNRPYTVHEAKSGSRPLFHEFSLMFDDALRATALNRYRAIPSMSARDTHPFFFFAHFVVERAREAMLWSWVVAKHGGDDDEWNEENAWKDLGGQPGDYTLKVEVQPRGTLLPAHMGELLGPAGIGKTKYEYSSMDGYPYGDLGDRGRQKWPNLTSTITTHANNLHPYYHCEIARACLAGSRASAVFKNISFAKTECGDCITRALVAKSGSLGLSAFLPPAERAYPPSAHIAAPDMFTVPPHLPLTRKWSSADFTLASVLRRWTHPPLDGAHDGARLRVSVRRWAVHVMHRYRFVIGNTPSHFVQLSSPLQAKSLFARIPKTVALLCINDDIVVRPADADRVFRQWQESVWNVSAAWER